MIIQNGPDFFKIHEMDNGCVYLESAYNRDLLKERWTEVEQATPVTLNQLIAKGYEVITNEEFDRQSSID